MNMKSTAAALTIAFAVAATGCATAPASAPARAAAAQAPATAAAPAAAPAHKYSTSDTPIGELLDNPKTRAVLDQNIPGFTSAPQLDMARSMTLRAVQPYATDTLTDEVLTKVDAAFATLQ